MKAIHLILLAGLFLLSCDDRLDFLVALNEAPSIVINKDAIEYKTQFADSIKTSLKNGNSPYLINLIVSDPEKLLGTLTYKVLEGNAVISQDGQVVTNITYDADGKAQVLVQPKQVGIHRIEFIISDNLSNTSKVVFIATSFDNIVPVAVMDLTRIAVNSPLEYDMVADRSYDKDKKQGGGLVFYEWDINGSKFTSSLAVSRFIFPSSGTYEIKLRVQDNNGAFSAPVARVLTLN